MQRDARFWYVYLTWAFGMRQERFDEDLLVDCFGIDSDATFDWWNQLTGWYEGVLETSDGYVENPGWLEVALEGGEALVLEAHPGDLYLHRRRPGVEAMEQLANFGPHWEIPEWSLEDARALAGANPFAFLLLAPLVQLRTDEEALGEAVFSEMWQRATLLDQATSIRLAREWVRVSFT